MNMKNSFITIAMAMVMMVVFAMPVYADRNSVDGDNNSAIAQENSTIGDVIIIDVEEGAVQCGDAIIENGAVTIGDITAGDATGGNLTLQEGAVQGGQGGEGGDGGNVCFSGNSKIGDIDNSNSNNANNSANNSNSQEVNIESPDELKVNSQLNPMAGQQVSTLEYHGKTLEDHKYQDEILAYLLSSNELKPFVVREHGFFTRKSSHSTSESISVKEYEETTVVYVFRDLADLNSHIKNYSTIGFADTFSKGKATLMDCFDQAVIDSGDLGGNILLLLDVDYMTALASTTVGLGGSGAGGFMKNSTQSSVFGAALGYAKSKATPETDPFIHGMILYSPELVRE